MKFARLTSFVLTLCGSFHSATGQTGEELASIYEDAFASYAVFPPINPDPSVWESDDVRPIEVVAGLVIVSVDDISPGSSEFTVTSRMTLYWRANDCNQTETHQLACDTKLSGGAGTRFVSSDNAKAPPQVSLDLYLPTIHETIFESQGQTDIQPNAEFMESTSTYTNVSNLPWVELPSSVH